MPKPNFEPGKSRSTVWCVTSGQPTQLLVTKSQALKLYQCHGSKHKQTKPSLQTTPFLESRFSFIFSGVVFTAKTQLKRSCKPFWSKYTGLASSTTVV